ncbi:tyrosine-type recombinase/integrase [Planomicrobium sp. CPCC 101079]|uniref:tyrosine-type recombinase/integrase n=1 Tax=Planomicrobium sp. CPCC 101079 TaxID=2599618 RepID=UPI0011B7E5DF|nr:tyrosine-type recombinase/integrase [Planomicrobium sp. CPCC 101079]TWT00113.1 site-specific integrase [Planomicrobium sp. CPCC 101079]
MTKITEYIKNGKKYYMFKVYLGKNPTTGKEISTTRRNFKTKGEANTALMRLKLAASEGEYFQQTPITFKDVYTMWLVDYKNGIEDSTLKKTESIFKNHILPKLADTKIAKITPTLCKTVINEWTIVKHTRTIKNYASSVLDFAVTNNFLKTNPFSNVPVPRKIENTDRYANEDLENIEFYSKEELTIFLNALDMETNMKVKTFYRLLVYTGMRKGEAFALTWGDIDFTDNEIKITKALGQGENNSLYIKNVKNGVRRTLSIDEETIEILREWKMVQSQDYKTFGFDTSSEKQLLFSNLKNTFMQPSYTFKWMKKICARSNLRYLNTHGLRHTHCSLLFEAGATVKEVQVRLGHKDIKTTLNVYTHLSEKSKIETIKKFENFLKKE